MEDINYGDFAQERVIDMNAQNGDEWQYSLRPRHLREYIGQKKRPYSQAWKYRDELRKMQKLQEDYLFLVRATFRQRRGLCPSGRDALRISSLPKRSTSKILLCPLSVVSPYEHFDSPFIHVVANRPAGTVF